MCKICGEIFLRKRSQIIYGGGYFCSNRCRFEGRKTGKKILCTFCGIEVYRPLGQLGKSKSGNHYCSKDCLFKWIAKEYDGHPNWKGGMYTYRDKLKKTNIIAVCGLCGEKDQRMLVVHHIDQNRANSSLENLTWLCHNCHHLVHTYEGEKMRFMSILGANDS